MERDELETEREREGRGAERQLHPIFSPELLKDLRGCGKWIKEKLKSKTHSPIGTPGTAHSLHLCAGDEMK